MFKIKPFKGYIYNVGKVKDLSLVTAPPYDVISKEEQDNLYKKSPYNVVRLILNKEEPDDGPLSKYKRAGEFFKKWQGEEILIRDDKESIYIYEQEFNLKGEIKRRKGFISLVKLQDFSEGTVKPHEKTLSAPKEDRLNLMRHCGANFSSIFGLYDDENNKIEEIINEIIRQKPYFGFISGQGIKERIWKLSDKNLIDKICQNIAEKSVFIADGHHRYETALNYRDEMRMKLNQKDGEYPYDYVMMTLIAMEDEGLVILPTHRLVFGLDVDKDKLIHELHYNFSIEKFNGSKDEFLGVLYKKGENNHAIGMILKNDKPYYILVLNKNPKDAVKLNKPDSLKSLDVTILHKLILNDILGLDEESMTKQANLKYEKSEDNVFKQMKSGEYEAAFLLNPTKIEELKAVAKDGERMPQKSTFFYPKLTTGLVINKIIDLRPERGDCSPLISDI